MVQLNYEHLKLSLYFFISEYTHYNSLTLSFTNWLIPHKTNLPVSF